MAAREPQHRSAPGLTTAAHATVAPYPDAAVVTAWFNAYRDGVISAPLPAPGIGLEEPLITTEASGLMWSEARLPLGVALARLEWPERAWVALPVPGDVDGVPAGCPRALSAGQAMVLGGADRSLVLVPQRLTSGDRMWFAVSAGGTTRRVPDVRTARQQIMSALEDAVLTAESRVLPLRGAAGAATRAVQQSPVPLPPGTAGNLVALASQSAMLVTLAEEFTRTEVGSTDGEVGAKVRSLGRLGRHGLAVAFSAPARD